MNQEIDKEIPEFTEKQKEAYKTVMKVLAKQELSRAQVYTVIKKAQIYKRDRDIKETAKMLIQNPNTPIEKEDGKIVNEYRGGEE